MTWWDGFLLWIQIIGVVTSIYIFFDVATWLLWQLFDYRNSR